MFDLKFDTTKFTRKLEVQFSAIPEAQKKSLI